MGDEEPHVGGQGVGGPVGDDDCRQLGKPVVLALERDVRNPAPYMYHHAWP